MDKTTVVAFRDEMEKIAGEMQGFTRIGRKPISVEKLIENEAELKGLPEGFPEQAVKVAKASAKSLALLGAGGIGALALRQANEDRKVGRMVRRQQSQ